MYVYVYIFKYIKMKDFFIEEYFLQHFSTASSGLNSLTAVTFEDIVKRRHPDISDQKAMIVSKVIG